MSNPSVEVNFADKEIGSKVGLVVGSNPVLAFLMKSLVKIEPSSHW